MWRNYELEIVARLAAREAYISSQEAPTHQGEKGTTMDWIDYQENVKNDAMDAIKEGMEYADNWDEMYDSLFVDDSVTGNASGSYYCNSAKAEEAVSGIIFDADAVEEFKAMGYDGIPTGEGAETCDVIARCIALGLVSGELEDYYNSLREDEDEDED